MSLEVLERTTAPATLATPFAFAVTATPSPNNAPLRRTSDDSKIITMEDGGQSEGASATSLRAAYLLAHIDDDVVAQDIQPVPAASQLEAGHGGGSRYRRTCDGHAPYCC